MEDCNIICMNDDLQDLSNQVGYCFKKKSNNDVYFNHFHIIYRNNAYQMILYHLLWQ